MTRRFLATILMMVFLFPAVWASASDVPVRLNLYNEGGVLTKQVKSMKELRQQQMVPQSRDFSCGAAALATIMHYYYGQPVTELDAILGMFKHGDQQDIRKRGFSLLDMKRYANALKYKADGFKVKDVKILKSLTVPVIVLIETGSYKHFVVIRRVGDRFVYISDPSWGNRKVPVQEFNKIWDQKVIFAVQGPKVGNPEGLYAERSPTASKVSRMLVQEPFRYDFIPLDPADSMVFISNTPLVVIPFIPGQ
ncbi:MAG: C39 family peptidase [Syntrophobacterales bacterium]